MTGEVVDDDVGSVAREHARDAAADRAIAAGARDHGDAVRESAQLGGSPSAAMAMPDSLFGVASGHTSFRRETSLAPNSEVL